MNDTKGANIGPDGKPECKNMRLIGHCGMEGRGDIFHINVVKGYAFCGHLGLSRIGTSVIDVRDPRKPFVVAEIPAPPNIHSTKVQIVDDVLLVNTNDSAIFSAPVQPSRVKKAICCGMVFGWCVATGRKGMAD